MQNIKCQGEKRERPKQCAELFGWTLAIFHVGRHHPNSRAEAHLLSETKWFSTEHSVEASVVQGMKCGAFVVRSSNQAPHHDSNEKNSAHYRCALLGMIHSATFPAKTRYSLRLLCGEIHSAHCIAGHGGKRLQRLMPISHSFHVQILKQ